MTLEEAQYHIWQCAARAAQIRGLAGSDFYTVEEIYEHLRKHPETFERFDTFSRAYLDWAQLNYETHQTRTENKCDPVTLRELQDLTQKRDQARTDLLRDLGLA